MDHSASQRAARLLVLQTEDHAAADNDGLQGEATKPRESGDSGQVCPRAHPGINETCAGLSRNQASAAEWGSWWRWPRSHLALEAGVAGPTGLRGTEALPARLRPAPSQVPAASSRMRACPLAPITESRSSARFTREQGRPAHRAPRPQRAPSLASCSRVPGGRSMPHNPRPAEPVRPG